MVPEWLRRIRNRYVSVTITDRDITQSELDYIYEDFKRIEINDGIPQYERKRYQFIAEENGIVIGFVSGLTHHRWFYLSDLWVHENHRRHGLGTKLLIMMEEKVWSLRIEHIYTWTSGFTNPLFYEKMGYRKFTVFENFYEIDGYHQIGYRKDTKIKMEG